MQSVGRVAKAANQTDLKSLLAANSIARQAERNHRSE